MNFDDFLIGVAFGLIIGFALSAAMKFLDTYLKDNDESRT